MLGQWLSVSSPFVCISNIVDIKHRSFLKNETMKSFLASLILAIICLTSASAFSVRPSVVPSVSTSVSSTSLNVFGNRKSKAQQVEEEDPRFWQGEWVCKDCGYIYQKVSLKISSKKGNPK
jgi:hypothetical protein